MLMAGGQFLDAQTRAEKALAIDPKNVDAQLVKGASLAGMKKLDEAVGQVEAAIEAEPLRVGSHLDLGMLESHQGKQGRRRAGVQACRRGEPELDTGETGARELLLDEHRAIPNPKPFSRSSTRAHPKNVQINRALAAFYLSTKQPALAEQPLKTILEVNKDDASRVRLADYYMAIGRATRSAGDDGVGRQGHRRSGVDGDGQARGFCGRRRTPRPTPTS